MLPEKVWLDILTPKQLFFFEPLVKELEQRECKVLCTTRDYRELNQLLDLTRLNVKVVGKHGGKNLKDKLVSSSERILKLTELITDFNPNLSISFASPECTRISFGLQIPHICINDSPHSSKVMKLTLPLSDLLLCPWIIPTREWIKYGISKDKIVKYKAIDVVAWIKRRRKRGKNVWKLKDLEKFIVVRLPEIFASYIEDKEYDLKLIREILKLKGFDIVVLCRYDEQLKKFKEEFSSDSRVIIPDKVVDSIELLKRALAFIGMGGTMTWESSLLGVPTISLWKGSKLYIEDYLSKKGLLFKARKEDEALSVLKVIIEDHKLRKKIKKKAERILNSMEDPIKRIVEEVEKFKKNCE